MVTIPRDVEHQCTITVHPNFTTRSSKCHYMLKKNFIREPKTTNARLFAEQVAPKVVFDLRDVNC